MMKRSVSLLLALALILVYVPGFQSVSAATQSSYAPYAYIEYGYSSTVKCGTVRYVSQVSSDSYFYSSYWPTSNFGYYVGPQVECGTASISMALSYIGVNKTAKDILNANNGATVFATGWGGSTYYSYSSLSTAVSNYLNGNGKYSPPVIHLPGYSAAGHYVVVIGQISSGVYQILDPWQRALTQMTVSGSSATYSTYGVTKYDTIDQVHQWYNASASVDYTSTCTAYASYCKVQSTQSTPINSQPCSVGSYGSVTLETVPAGTTFTAVGMYKNTFGNYWYKVTTSSGKTGYLYGGHAEMVELFHSDVKLTGATAPNGQVKGNGYYVNGTISTTYSDLSKAALYVYSGFGMDGSVAMSATDTASGKSYPLPSSYIDATTKFGSLATGNYTYVIRADYKNYYCEGATTLKTDTGTVELMAEYFVVIPSSVSQTTCSHTMTTTTLTPNSCTSGGEVVKSCSKCGLVEQSSTGATGHSYSGWTTVKATCTTDGYQRRTCSGCGHVETVDLPATGHSYTTTFQQATCTSYARYVRTCGNCGEHVVLTADQMTTTWMEEIPEGMDPGLFRTKTQYRYSDAETATSYETSLPGYTFLSSAWEKSGSGTVTYVPTWTTGFSTSSSLYSQYNKKSSKVTASETATSKTVIDSDAAVGYLYHHWCYANSFYSVQSSSGSYTTFHAFYSTTKPSSLSNYDANDGSYYFPNSTTCSNSEWWWPTTVYAQKYTTYKKLNTFGRWVTWSDWSDNVVTASSTRKVETRTVYQLKSASLGDHSWSNGSCIHCGDPCVHSFADGFCTVCGMAEPIKDYYLFGYINGANYACEEDAANMGQYKFVDGRLVATFSQVSYVAVKTNDNYKWYMTEGYQGDVTSVTLHETGTIGNADKLRVPRGREITFTLKVNEDGTLTLSYVAAGCEHDWQNGTCVNCDEVCEHISWAFGTCEDCGLVCAHSWVEGTCSVCGSICAHKYQNNVCKTCGYQKPQKEYYLFGWINDSDYGCEGDYQNLGIYKFVDGSLTTTFPSDSYVAVKSHDNMDWYMTNGWLGYDVTAATLYNTNSGIIAEKLYVPGNREVTFYLVDNGNDTYTLSYVVKECEHPDHGTDGKCTVCGETVDHRYSTVVTRPTCTKSGFTTYTCQDCGHSYTGNTVAALGHSWTGGVCSVCGAKDPNAVKDPGLTMRYPTLSFEDEIYYNVYYSVADTSDVAEMGLMLLSSRNDAATMDDAIGTVPGYITNGTVYMVRTESVPAAHLGDTVYFKVYARLTDGTYRYSAAGGYNAKAYANSILSGNYTGEMKSLVVAMLNYGAEAQKFFGHNTGSLVNASLTAAQKALVAAYDEAMVDPLGTVDSSKVGGFVRNNANFRQLYPSVSFDGAFAINFYCTPAISVDSGMTLYWWDAEDYANISMFTLGNATGKMTMTENGGNYWGEVAGIAAKDMDKTYYVSCVFKHNGTYTTTGIIPYSLGRYCEGKAATNGDAQQAFAQATAVYGYYAKGYFASIA